MAKPKVEKKTKESKATIGDVLKAIVEMNKNLNNIASLIAKPADIIVKVDGSSSGSSSSVPANSAGSVSSVSEEPKQQEYKFPIPPEFKEVVETTLNKRFGIDIEYKSETAAFAFSILVPKEYSEASPAYWATHGEDRRTRVILNALGANGVREWATTVYNSFSSETKAKIVFDRGQVN